MTLLVVFSLFFIPALVFSTELGSFSDYAGETREANLKECYIRTVRNYRIVYTDDQIKAMKQENLRILGECIKELSKINPKLRGIEQQLTEKLVEVMEFELRMSSCSNKLDQEKNNDEVVTCQNSLKGFDTPRCDQIWGKNGCFISNSKKYCGLEITKEYQEFAVFMEKDQKQCIDKYFTQN